MTGKPLHAIGVLEASSGFAAGLCGLLLQRHGAAVTRISPDAGDDLEPATRAWLDQGKQVVQAAAADNSAAPDVVIVDGLPGHDRGRWEPRRLAEADPNVIVVSITPFGESGPWRTYRTNSLALDALSGTLLMRGGLDRPPVTAPRYVPELTGALHAYAGTLAALTARERGSAGGEIVDVSLFDSVAAYSETQWSSYNYLGTQSKRGFGNGVPGLLPCANGYVMAFLWGPVAWKTFGAAIGDEHFHLLETAAPDADPEKVAASRLRASEWLRHRTKQEAMEEGQRLHLTFGYSATIPDLLADPQVKERGFLKPMELEGKQLLMPDVPFVVEGGSAGAEPVHWEAAGGLPLSGVSIVDLSAYWAGPIATRLLADLGADVIKVEGPSRPDPVRTQHPKDGVYLEEDEWERGWWNGLNAGKRSLAIELGTPLGRDLFLELASRADVVFENFSRGVLPKFGLGWEQLKQTSDTVSLVSSSAFGRTGPYRDYIAFGVNLEPLTGVSELAGYADGTPELVQSNLCDPIAGIAAAGALLTLLFDRLRNSSAGTYLDLAQRDTMMPAIAWAFARAQLTGVVPTRNGNNPEGLPIQDCFPCLGEEQYVAVSAATAAECEAIRGLIDLTAAPVGDLERALRRWCLSRTKFEAFHALQAAGVVAAPLLDMQELDENPQLAARGFFRSMTTAAGFSARGMTQGFQFVRHPVKPRDRVPRFGEHNAEVLRQAGVSSERIAEAARAGVIAARPTAVFPQPLTRPAVASTNQDRKA